MLVFILGMHFFCKHDIELGSKLTLTCQGYRNQSRPINEITYTLSIIKQTLNLNLTTITLNLSWLKIYIEVALPLLTAYIQNKQEN